MKTILMIAAEAREFHGLLSRQTTRTLQWGLRFSCETDLNGNKAVLIADGPGMQLAGGAADIARRFIRPDVVVSTGFCGAVDPALNAGDVFNASVVIDREHGKRYKALSADTTVPCQRGDLLCINHVANSAAAKRELRSSGASAVEMESGAVANRAQVWDLPFYCIKSVSDTADESFHVDFNRMRDRNGRFSRERIILSALAKPWSRIPSLLKLNSRCGMASRSLGEFLANCRF